MFLSKAIKFSIEADSGGMFTAACNSSTVKVWVICSNPSRFDCGCLGCIGSLRLRLSLKNMLVRAFQLPNPA